MSIGRCRELETRCRPGEEGGDALGASPPLVVSCDEPPLKVGLENKIDRGLGAASFAGSGSGRSASHVEDGRAWLRPSGEQSCSATGTRNGVQRPVGGRDAEGDRERVDDAGWGGAGSQLCR